MPSVSNDHRQQDPRIGRSDAVLESTSSLPSTQDETRGSTNLATRPRAGNISTDMRAGRPC
jgi:hypothetical protein